MLIAAGHIRDARAAGGVGALDRDHVRRLRPLRHRPPGQNDREVPALCAAGGQDEHVFIMFMNTCSSARVHPSGQDATGQDGPGPHRVCCPPRHYLDRVVGESVARVGWRAHNPR